VESERAKRIRPFLIGGIVGSAAGLVAAGRMRVPRRPEKRQTPAGLAAFEEAPCYAETLEREAREEAAAR
jgi:8-oxo-dGTP pyrophosphatase MutT (NUDIX family)